MRLIDIEDIALIKTVSCGGLSAKKLWKRVNEQPTIDAVEVVRCKDCIHHDDFFMGAEGSLLCWKGGTDKVVSAMGYCECGERSEEIQGLEYAESILDSILREQEESEE